MVKTMNRALLTAVTAIALAGLAPSYASAQEVQITGPLAGQPAVRHIRQYRANRFFVSPSVGYTLQDEFARGLFFGGSAGYHFTDWLGLAIWGAAAPVDVDTDLTTQIGSNGQTTDRNRLSLPGREGFRNQVGRIRWGLALEALFIPLRGKLSLFQAAFVDTDLYVIAGVALMGVDERSEVAADANPCSGPMPAGSSSACLDSQLARSSRVAPAPMLGVGLSLMFNAFVGLQLEWRAFPFSWNPSGTDESGRDATGAVGSGFGDGAIDGADSRTTFKHMFNAGVVIYLPTQVAVSE